MAQPDVRIGHEAIFQAPLGPDHLFPGKGFSMVRQLADDGAGGALEALLQVFAALVEDAVEEIPGWSHDIRIWHSGDTP
jgi:hypothetical protein